MESLGSVLMIFLSVVFALASVYSLVSDLWLTQRQRVRERLDAEFSAERRERIQQSPLFKDLNRLATEQGTPGEIPLSRLQRVELWLEQAGVNLTPRQLLNWMLIVGVATGLACLLLQPNVLVGLCAIVAGAMAPVAFVAFRHKRRRGRMVAQLPEAFETMARAMRAGSTVPEAIRGVSHECEAPLGDEFAYCFEQQNLGLSPETTFQDLARRTGLLELRLFALVVLVQQQSGGNLAEVFDNLAQVVRSRLRTEMRTQTLTSESRLQAYILLGIPPLMFFVLLLMRREYAQVLLDTPSLLWLTLGLQVVGWLWIRRILRVEA